jgi:hypothetical protein
MADNCLIEDVNGGVLVPRLKDLAGLLPLDYWNRTHQVQNSGRTPHCCGDVMVPEDDHGRFVCFGCGRRVSV